MEKHHRYRFKVLKEQLLSLEGKHYLSVNILTIFCSFISGWMACLPITCLGLILFNIAAIIVLSLIPLYTSTRDVVSKWKFSSVHTTVY